jgi:hypothetical protein
VAGTAEVWFHAASLPGGAQPDPAGSLQMLAMYPTIVRRWAISAGALEDTSWSRQRMLTGEQLIGMGVPRCS